MADWSIKLLMWVNRFFIRLSRGRMGSLLGTQEVLLLHSLGRKTGRSHIVPIAYYFSNGFYFIVGSNWGKDAHADWYHNLKAHPQTTIEVKGRTIPVLASEAEGAEYDGLWAYAIERNPPYLRYKEMTRRHIPIIILRPLQ